MKLFLVVAAVALTLALAWGFYAGGQPALARSGDLTVQVADAWHDQLPREPEAATQAYLDRVPDEMRARGEAVSQTRYVIWGARILGTLGALAFFLFSGAASGLAKVAARVSPARWMQDGVFALAFMALLFVTLLPIDVYAGFVRMRGFGFSDRPFLDWLIDRLINWGAITIFYVVGIALFMALLRNKPKTWPTWATGVYFGLAIVYVIASPLVIEPLTNKFTPIPESAMKSEIMSMALANEVPVDNVYTSNASRQTRLLNAHVSGIFGTAQVTLDDNLLAGQYAPGVRYVVAHEIGHYVMGHVMIFVVFLTALAAIGFTFIAWTGPALIGRFGGRWGISDLRDTAGIAVFWLVFLVWSFVSAPADNAFSRWQESRADLYGLNASQAPNGMAEFMIHDADTARLNPSELDVFLFYDHPSDKARIEMAMRWRAAHMGAQEQTN